MNKLQEAFKNAAEELIEANRAKEDYELEYSIEEARMVFSAEVSALGNQTMRDAQIRILMEENGMYRKLVEVRTASKEAYYRWQTLRTLLEGGAQ